MRLVLALAIGALLALPTGAAKIPDSIPVPRLAVGDAWEVKGKSFTQTHEVVAVEAGILQIRIEQTNVDGSKYVYAVHQRAVDLATVKEVHNLYRVEYDEPCVRDAWPIHVGKTWTSVCDGKTVNADGGEFPFSRTAENKVLSTETVTVPAGTFETMLVERNFGSGVTLVWHSASGCGEVRKTIDGEGGSLFELVKASCAAAATGVGDNDPPVVSCTFTHEIGNTHETYVLTWTATDPNGDTVRVELLDPNAKVAHTTTGGGTKEFRGAWGNVGAWTVAGEDGKGARTEAACVDAKTIGNRAPDVACTGAEWNMGTLEEYTVTWTVTDPDGDAVFVQVLDPAGTSAHTAEGPGTTTFRGAWGDVGPVTITANDRRGGTDAASCPTLGEIQAAKAKAADAKTPAPGVALVALAAAAVALALRRRA